MDEEKIDEFEHVPSWVAQKIVEEEACGTFTDCEGTEWIQCDECGRWRTSNSLHIVGWNREWQAPFLICNKCLQNSIVP
jgi:hypothetical protein